MTRCSAGAFRDPGDAEAPGCRAVVPRLRPGQLDAFVLGLAGELGGRGGAAAARVELVVAGRAAGQHREVGYFLCERADRELVLARLALPAGADGLTLRVAQAPVGA